MQRPGDDEYDIVNHICIPAKHSVNPSNILTGLRNPRHVFQKFAQWLDGIAPQVIELLDKHLGRLVLDGRSGDGQGFICEEVTIVRRRQLCPEVCHMMFQLSVLCLIRSRRTLNGLALGEVVVLILGEEAGLVPPDNTLQETTRNLRNRTSLSEYERVNKQ